jgi:predicted metallopeptidase
MEDDNYTRLKTVLKTYSINSGYLLEVISTNFNDITNIHLNHVC